MPPPRLYPSEAFYRPPCFPEPLQTSAKKNRLSISAAAVAQCPPSRHYAASCSTRGRESRTVGRRTPRADRLRRKTSSSIQPHPRPARPRRSSASRPRTCTSRAGSCRRLLNSGHAHGLPYTAANDSAFYSLSEARATAQKWAAAEMGSSAENAPAPAGNVAALATHRSFAAKPSRSACVHASLRACECVC